jgi:geranylgeranyl diphosphate synthase type II
MDVKRYLQEKKEIVDSALEKYLLSRPGSGGEGVFPTSLHKAIRYSLFAGGKRIRPILSMAALKQGKGRGNPSCLRIEMIHTYSSSMMIYLLWTMMTLAETHPTKYLVRRLEFWLEMPS